MCSVSLEILTVLGAGPIAFYILKQLASSDPARHYWIIVLCTGELYGGCVACALLQTCCVCSRCYRFVLQFHDLQPRVADWQPKPRHIESSLPLGVSLREYIIYYVIISADAPGLVHEYHVREILPCYFVSPNLLIRSFSWVIIPIGLMIDSYNHIASSLRAVQAQKTIKNE